MNRSLLTFLLLVLAATVAAWLMPGAMVQPGRLLPAHQDLANTCSACHEALRGVAEERCSHCHEPGEIGIRTSKGVDLKKPRPAVRGLHQRNRDHGCPECHSEHAGRLGQEVAARFTHQRLPEGIRQDCVACHGGQEAQDALHARAGGNCASCHGVEAWTPATFDHALLAAGSSCHSCHAKDKPADELHGRLAPTGDCEKCHATQDWRPARYDHAAYFRFDGHHPAHCADCHQKDRGYSRYTCTGCHAHSAARVAAEHREEGISNWQDCVRCHRSGEEEDAGESGEGRGGREHGEGDEEDD